MTSTTNESNLPPHAQARDRVSRILLGHPKMLLDLLIGYFRFSWTESIDPDTIQNYSLPSIAPNLAEHRHDAVWRIPVGQDQARYVYVMLEFQSNRRWNMAMRMVAYVAALYDSLMSRGEIKHKHAYPAVLPIVVYVGDEVWTPKLEASELVEPAPEGLQALQVSHRYLLLDVKRLPDQQELQSNRVEALFRVERSGKPEDLDNFVAMVSDLFPGPGYDDFKQAIIGWAYHVMQKAMPSERLPEPGSVEEVQTMLQSHVLPWGEQKRAEGRAEGRTEGQKELVVKMARSRFGDSVAQMLSARLANEASFEHFERISELIYACATGDAFLAQLQQRRV